MKSRGTSTAQRCYILPKMKLLLLILIIYVALSLSNGPLLLCVLLYVIYVGGWLGVQRIRHGRRGGGFVMVVRFIIFSTSANSFIKHTHSSSLMTSLTTELLKLTGSPRGTNNITANKL